MKKNEYKTWEDIHHFTKQVNKHFGIRVTKKGGDSRLLSLYSLGKYIDSIDYAVLMASRALWSRKPNPTFRYRGYTIVFFWR